VAFVEREILSDIALLENFNVSYHQAPADFFGFDTLSYGISDGNGGTAFSNVSVNVNLSSNDAVRNNSGSGSLGGWLVMILAVSVNYINLGKGSAELQADVSQSPEEHHRTVAKVTPALGYGIGLDVDYTLWENDKVSLNGIRGALAWRTEFESEYQGQKIESTEDGIDPYIAFALKEKLSSNVMLSAKVSRYFIRLSEAIGYVITLWLIFVLV
jgi:hypothetical protein